MRVPVEVVREHLAALTHYDWTVLENTVSEGVRLQLVGTEGWNWALSTLYRHVSQAWDFASEEVRLSDQGDGTVRAQIRLTNGGGLVKQIEGEYHVRGDRIDSIRLTDEPPVRAGREGGHAEP